jgi:hypothetical protein
MLVLFVKERDTGPEIALKIEEDEVEEAVVEEDQGELFIQ